MTYYIYRPVLQNRTSQSVISSESVFRDGHILLQTNKPTLHSILCKPDEAIRHDTTYHYTKQNEASTGHEPENVSLSRCVRYTYDTVRMLPYGTQLPDGACVCHRLSCRIVSYRFFKPSRAAFVDDERMVPLALYG